MGFRPEGSGFKVYGLGVRDWGLKCAGEGDGDEHGCVNYLGLMVRGLGFREQGCGTVEGDGDEHGRVGGQGRRHRGPLRVERHRHPPPHLGSRGQGLGFEVCR